MVVGVIQLLALLINSDGVLYLLFLCTLNSPFINSCIASNKWSIVSSVFVASALVRDKDCRPSLYAWMRSRLLRLGTFIASLLNHSVHAQTDSNFYCRTVSRWSEARMISICPAKWWQKFWPRSWNLKMERAGRDASQQRATSWGSLGINDTARRQKHCELSLAQGSVGDAYQG